MKQNFNNLLTGNNHKKAVTKPTIGLKNYLVIIDESEAMRGYAPKKRIKVQAKNRKQAAAKAFFKRGFNNNLAEAMDEVQGNTNDKEFYIDGYGELEVIDL